MTISTIRGTVDRDSAGGALASPVGDDMIERVARAIVAGLRSSDRYADIDDEQLVDVWIEGSGFDLKHTARAAIEAMCDVENDVLGKGYEAMFADKWDGSQAPMMAAGLRAMIAAALHSGQSA